MVKRWLGWDQLNTKTLEDGSSAQDINLQSKGVHLQESNKEVLKDVVLVNAAAQRDGRPIPNTQQVSTTTVTDSNRTVGFAPNEGEVWSVMNITASRSNITSSSGVTLYINDTVNSVLQTFFYGTSSSADFMLDDDGTWDDFVISYPCRLEFVAHNPANWDDCTLQVNMIRLR
jgi:hypothetical protein